MKKANAKAREALDPEVLRNLLPANEKSKRHFQFAVTDIESRAKVFPGETKPRQTWTEYLVGGTYAGSEVFFHRSLKEHVDFLIDYCHGRIVFAHFGGIFDFLHFLHHAVFFDRRIQISPIVPRGSGMLTFKLTRGDNTVTLFDSSALFPFKLASVTASFGTSTQKQAKDDDWYNNLTEVRYDCLSYLTDDLKGLYEALELFYGWPLIKRAGPAMTLASQAMKVLQLSLKSPVYALARGQDEQIRLAYTGGRTEIFRPYFSSDCTRGEKRVSAARGLKPSTERRSLFCYDVVSLYPTVMQRHRYPNAFLHSSEKFDPKGFGFFYCDVSCPRMYIPFLGVTLDTKSGRKLIFPTGKFSGLYSIPEINYARKLGYQIRTRNGLLFSDGGYLFRDFVDELFPLKKNAKDKVTRTISKLLLNSCYGRFGISKDKENLVFDEGQIGIRPLDSAVEVGGKKLYLGFVPTTLQTFSNVAVAAYVTAYARIHMHPMMLKVAASLYYTDTDCLFTTERLPTGDDLGDLEFQGEYDEACFLLPKTYALSGGGEREVKMKGFDSRKVQHFTVADFYSRLEGEMHSTMEVEVPERLAHFRTAARLKFILGMQKKSKKQLQSVYDKRTLFKDKNGNWDSKPIHL